MDTHKIYILIMMATKLIYLCFSVSNSSSRLTSALLQTNYCDSDHKTLIQFYFTHFSTIS